MTVVAITGHRPEKIKDFAWVEKTLAEVLLELEPQFIIQGMAAGVDLLAAEIAYANDIPYIAARPWATHTGREGSKYPWTLENAAAVVTVDPAVTYAGPWVYQKRNEYMVDHATVVVAVWDGSASGTKNCVTYANRNGVPVVRINPVKKTVEYPAPEPEATKTDDTQLFLF
jgi:uncharacterized phage-like protein YoqJ